MSQKFIYRGTGFYVHHARCKKIIIPLLPHKFTQNRLHVCCDASFTTSDGQEVCHF